jgi:hypothetical protein
MAGGTWDPGWDDDGLCSARCVREGRMTRDADTVAGALAAAVVLDECTGVRV